MFIVLPLLSVTTSASRMSPPLFHVFQCLLRVFNRASSTSPTVSAPRQPLLHVSVSLCSTSPKTSAPRLCSTSLLHVSTWLHHCISPITVSHLPMFLVRSFTASNCNRVWYTLMKGYSVYLVNNCRQRQYCSSGIYVRMCPCSSCCCSISNCLLIQMSYVYWSNWRRGLSTHRQFLIWDWK